MAKTASRGCSSAVVYMLNIGNTHSSLVGWNASGQHLCELRWHTEPQGARVKAATFRELRDVIAGDGPALLLSSVVPAYERKLLPGLQALFSVLRFRTDVAPPLQIRPQPAERVGDDRIAAAVGALSVSQRSCIAVDVGTAVTVNAVKVARGRKASFEGGVIMPGLALGLQALGAGTAQLPPVSGGAADAEKLHCIGRTTARAMTQGVMAAVAGGIVLAVKAQVSALERNTDVYVTGGGVWSEALTRRIQQETGCAVTWDRLLVHRGLFESWRTAGTKSR